MNMIDDQTTIQTNVHTYLLDSIHYSRHDKADSLLAEVTCGENKFKFKDVKKNPRKVKLRRKIEEDLDSLNLYKNDELADLGWH